MADLRPGTEADTRAAFELFRDSLDDLLVRTGYATPSELAETPRDELWRHKYESLYDHLAETASAFWVAEEDERLAGYARAIDRDGLVELTELFVSPAAQSGGLGRELLRRTLANGDLRVILATTDTRALALYLRSGLSIRCPVVSLGRPPQATAPAPGLEAQRLGDEPDALERLAAIDRAVLGHTRDADHRWLLADRTGYLYRHGGEPVGYGYVGALSGPVATLDPAHMPGVLEHLEAQAARRALPEVWFDVPALNEVAVAHLLARGFRLDSFVVQLLSDRPFGALDRYVISSPTFFL